MSTITSETAFEAFVEETLLRRSDWEQLPLTGWDKEQAHFPQETLQFIRDTQSKVWEQLGKVLGDRRDAKVLEDLYIELDAKGMLHVLRHGFKCYGKTVKVAYFKPAHGLNPEVEALYARNRLTVTRQVPCHPGDGSTMDLTFCLNGLPVATCELKNPATGQTYRRAIRQYRTDRDPRAPLFSFNKRALVHFAVDTEEVHMTTKLAGDRTYFLPFNRGSHPGEVQCGEGNPQHPSGYRSGYFWQEVLHRDSFLHILGSFMFIEHSEARVHERGGKLRSVKKEIMIFPRYHQLDAVRKLVAASREDGAGKSYLIQHSAGSGKTNSIAWLSHRLANLHDRQDRKLFDCVVVITDRRVLDQQLQDAIFQIEHAQGVVQPIDENSQQLAKALMDGTSIVITTLQKFPFVLRNLLNVAAGGSYEQLGEVEKAMAADEARVYEAKIAQRRYAVIVDEAHSSQSGEAAREMKAILGAGTDWEDDEEDLSGDEMLAKVLRSRGRQKNLSFFAFTATPKAKTLELFGHRGKSGKPEAFHTYSMRQAIEEGFIKDVLRNYTTYSTYYRLVKAVEDDPNVPKKKATKSLAKFMSLHPYNIAQKTEVIIEHFRQHIAHQLGAEAKAMVVCSSRLHAVRYMRAFQKYIREHGYKQISPMVAFSGSVKDDESGLEEAFTEPQMNIDVVSGQPISEKQLPERFDSPDYNVLLVANKYQTGFDQPKLMAMYVDKRLDGVQAVQTLSRLNRNHSGKGDPFVLDFVNDTESIFTAFKPYFDATELAEETEPSQLETLKHELEQAQVYHASEVEAFAKVFYKPQDKHKKADHAELVKLLQPAKDRFYHLEEEAQVEFRNKLKAFTNLYSYLSQIIPYVDADLERRFTFGRFLLKYIPTQKDDRIIDVTDDVDLRYYRLTRLGTNTIDLKTGEIVPIEGPKEVGTGRSEDEDAPLSTIIEVLNERFGTEFTDADKLFFDQVKEDAIANPTVRETALANDKEKFALGIRSTIKGLMTQRMAQNDRIVTKYLDDEAFEEAAFSWLAREVYSRINK